MRRTSRTTVPRGRVVPHTPDLVKKGWRPPGRCMLCGLMLIERVDTRTDDVRPYFDLYTAAQKVDDPQGPPTSFTDFRGDLIWGHGGDAPEVWLGWADRHARLLGGYALTLPARDNDHLGVVDLVVHPEVRRHGYGRALATHACDQIREAGRRLVVATPLDGSPGLAFCDASGAARAAVELRNVLDLKDVDTASLHELLAEAQKASGGYSLLSWTGTVPTEHLGGVAVLRAAMSDAPVDDLEWGDEVWDAPRIREAEKRVAPTGLRVYSIVARHDASGELVAYTQLLVPAEHQGWAFQDDTVVLANHRGRRLGLHVKAAMLQWLTEREPEVSRIVTFNAESNDHMLRVNRALGFWTMDRWICCQLSLQGR